MKRTLSLIVLLGLVVGAMVTGCQPKDGGTGDTATNAVPPTTNAPAAP